MPKFECEVATPTSQLFEGEIGYAHIPGAEGEYGVMAGHEMIVGTNKPGVLTLWLDEAGNERKRYATYTGFTQFVDNKLSVLANRGVDLDTVDVDALREQIDTLSAQIEELEGGKEATDEALLSERKEELAFKQLILENVQA
ncbi:MAG: F0F1 ATP synthase subunit epsilon [Eggerthellaceae bacterium]|jgi:F-type H+-transporting ATPase subunit epsilon